MQESITNVLKHAGPTNVTIALDYGSEAVSIRITDTGRTGGAPPTTRNPEIGEPGRGLIGMRERCHLLGGELTAAPGSGDGFEVTATLPLIPTGLVRG